MLRVLVIAGRPPPAFDPADAPFDGVARRIPFRIVRAEGSCAGTGPEGRPQCPAAPATREGKYDKVRVPLACKSEPRTHGRVEVEGTDEVTS